MRVLFVDDEVEFLQLMEKRLSRRGMEVSTAPDGQSALICWVPSWRKAGKC